MCIKILSVTPKRIKIEYKTSKPVEIKSEWEEQQIFNTLKSNKRKGMTKEKHKKRKSKSRNKSKKITNPNKFKR